MSLLNDLRILYRMAVSPIKGESHADRLESFYGGQAAGYDSFRERLLHGRKELYDAIPVREGGVWVEMGGGTGSNLEYLGNRIHRLAKVYIVDLSPSLLQVAQSRIEARGWSNVETVLADATCFVPKEQKADVVTFSYSLTMIPDWFAALEQAERILHPGGVLGAVDFYVSRKYPEANRLRHSWFTRTFWPAWFAMDNVFLNPDHCSYLHRHFRSWLFWESTGSVPYIPFSRVPHYGFVGRKMSQPAGTDSNPTLEEEMPYENPFHDHIDSREGRPNREGVASTPVATRH